MGLSMLAMAAGLYLPALAGYSGTIALVGTLAYVLSFALGAGPVPGLLVPEITPARIRGEQLQFGVCFTLSSLQAEHRQPCRRYAELSNSVDAFNWHGY